MNDLKDADFQRVVLVGLAIKCPCDEDAPEECPLNEIRLKEHPERLEWVRQLSDEQCGNVYRRHLSCYESWRQSLRG